MGKPMIETYEQALAFIHGRHKWTKTPTFDRLALILATLNHPEEGKKFIHVTGTNGKGSTSQMITSILRATGLKVGLFSSPFIERFNERIQDNNGQIPDDVLVELTRELAPLVLAQDQEHPGLEMTEFEVVTTLMFMYFDRYPVDVAVLEVGIGGTWDSTEIIPDKLASVITSVSYDHMHVLGDTLAEIAQNKAGIIQKNRPVIVGDLPDEAMKVVTDTAFALKSPVLMNGKDFKMVTEDSVHYVSENRDIQIELNLKGSYQICNAGVAITTVLAVAPELGLSISDENVQNGLSEVTWPARFETIVENPLVIVDGAHNVGGIEALIDTLRTSYADKKIGVIFGALTDKHFETMLDRLLQEENIFVDVVPFVAPNARQSITKLPFVHPRLRWQDSWTEALTDLQSQSDMVVITGSLYFVSEVRHVLKKA